MKRGIIYLIIGILLTGCEEQIPQIEHHITMLVDRTEANGYKPISEEILRYVQLTDDTDGIEISLRSISDINYNPKYTLVLPKAVIGWMANEDLRRKKVKRFYKQFSDTLIASNQKNYGYGNSEIYKSVVTELNLLARKDGIKKILLFSDLQEHSFFSVYNKQHLRLLQKDPQKVIEIFQEQATPLNNLNEIELHILYQPSKKDAALFTQLLNIYKTILEPKGVKITVGFHNTISI